MKKTAILCLCFLVACCLVPGGSESPVTSSRRNIERFVQDPLAVRSLSPVFDEFPDSSLVDFSYLLDPPAGKHGFVIAGDDGHFHFEKTGARVRFWGVTVASSHIDIPKERIERAVDAIARAGCNVLRLHEIDNRGAEKYNLVRRNIIDEAHPHNTDSRHFDAEYRDRVDFWISEAKKRGIHVYLVIRGYRTFRSGDGVDAADRLDRKAKPYGFFDPRLIELQDEYIIEWLFEHKNPYTGLPNGLDPAICLLEIENEDSLLFNPGEWIHFIEPYKTRFRQLFNEWLKEKYGDTETLKTAWSVPDGSWSALLEDENLEEGTVRIPDMKMRSPSQIKPEQRGEPLSHPLRQSDGLRFAVSLQRRFFARQRDLIRSRGCPIPLTAVVNSQIIPDTWSVIQELDFTGENAYQDHPSFKAGEAWVGQSFYQNKNYLRETGPWGLAAFMARYKWAGKPLVCREWANCWPNRYRGTANLAIAAQGLLQDYDGLIFFSYYTWGNQNACSAFGIQADPVLWGSFGYASDLFINGRIKPAKNLVDIAYTDADLFRWGHYADLLPSLAWDNRVQNRYFSGAVQSDADVRISSGRSGMGVFMGINNILWDVRFERWRSLPSSHVRKSIFHTSGYNRIHPGRSLESGDAPAEGEQTGSGDFFTSRVLNEGYIPLWNENGSCGGYLDPEQTNIILGETGPGRVLEAARGLLAFLEEPDKPFQIRPRQERFASKENRIIRDASRGQLMIDAPCFKAIEGEFNPGEKTISGELEVLSQSPVACVLALSLDGKPIRDSGIYSLKMTTIAHNRGEVLRPVKGDHMPGKYVLSYPGAPPVQTDGKPSRQPTVISLGGEPILRVFLVNGTWEAIIHRRTRTIDLFCDTPNIRFQLGEGIFPGGAPKILHMRKFYYEYPPDDPVEVKPDLIYPGFAKYVRLTWEK